MAGHILLTINKN